MFLWLVYAFGSFGAAFAGIIIFYIFVTIHWVPDQRRFHNAWAEKLV